MNEHGFDFTLPWDWATLEAHAAQVGCRDDVLQLQELISLEEAQFLFEQLTRLSDPTEIQKLSDYQRLQNEWGGSFYGMLPEQLVDEEIPVPKDFPSLLDTALLLVRVRDRNCEALSRVNPDYPLKFRKQHFRALTVKGRPPGWDLELDLSGVRAVLQLFRQEQVTPEDAAAVASLPAFAEMMNHRRNLGYIPEPLITEEGLAQLLYHAASRAPLPMVWKWLSSQNFFDLADVFLHREDYQTLIEELRAHTEDINNHVLGTIAQYATDKMRRTPFRDRVSSTVGWGISGWATAATGGINIEHFKDDYEHLLTTLIHETFHRFQLRICPAAPTVGQRARSFEDLSQFPFPDKRDGKFYEMITYIFLEGTATFVAPSHPPEDPETCRRRGAELLRGCFETIYAQGDLERAEELLNEGLKSNGPLFWFGEYMAEKIVEKYGRAGLGQSLEEGSPGFFAKYLSAEVSEELRLGNEIEVKVQGLAAMI